MRKSCIVIAAIVICTGCRRSIEEISPDNLAAIKSAAPVTAAAGDWPWWRGPEMTGQAVGATPPTTWSDRSNVLWQTAVPGRGHASPCVFGDQVFIATADEADETQSLVCYNRSDGQMRWSTTVHRGGFMNMHGKNSQASATPACDGQRVLAVYMNGGGIWVDAVGLDGSILWQQEAGKFTSRHGYGSSPVLYRSLVIVAGDNTGGGFLAALDRETGKIVWRVPRRNEASFATPIVAETGGREQLLLSGQGLVVSYDPASGQELWRTTGSAKSTANTVAWNDEFVFATGGFPENHVLAIRADGSGEVVWQNKVKDYVPSPLLVGELLFVVTDDGIAYCFEAKTGKEVWKKRLGGDFSASPILAGDHVYVPNERGTVYVFKPTRQYELVAENTLSSGGFASPVVCGDTIFLRTAENLYCIGSVGG